MRLPGWRPLLWLVARPVLFVLAPIARCLLFLIENSVRLIGACLIVLAFGLITFLTLVALHIRGRFFILPPWGPLSLVLGAYILGNILISYYRILTTGPGWAPLSSEYPSAPFRTCVKCQPGRLRVPRAHHCSVCERCVRRLDHHCPWINGCVGEANYHYFLVFVLWAWLGAAYVFGLLVYPFWIVIVKDLNTLGSLTDREREFLLLGFSLSFALSIALAILGVLHTYLVHANRTTLEFHLQIDAEPLSPTIADNLRFSGVFEWPRILWACPAEQRMAVVGPHELEVVSQAV